MPIELLVLRLIHVVGGIIWVGSTFFSFFFLLPAIKDAGPAGGQVMVGLQKHHMMTVLPITAILTMLSGLRLMHIVSGGFNPNYFATPMGRTYSIAAGLAIVGFLVGITIAKLQQAAASDATSKEMIQHEIQRLQSRVAMSGKLVLLLLTLAAAGMAIARYA